MGIYSIDLARIKSWPSKLQMARTQDNEPGTSKEAQPPENSSPRTTIPRQNPINSNPLLHSRGARRRSSSHGRTSFESLREGGPTQSFIISTQHHSGSLSEFDEVTNGEGGLRRVMTTEALLPSPALKEWRAELRHVEPSPKGGVDVRVDEVEFFEPVTAAKTAVNARVNHIISRLPNEVLDHILGYLLLDIPPTSSFAPRNADLLSCLLTCRELHTATLNVLYRHVTIPHSRIFAKMLNVIIKYPGLGALIRRLDFSHYTVIGLGRTRKANNEIQNLTATSLAKALKLMPNLREFLVHEHIDDVLVEDVLKILFSKQSIQAIDLCACSSSSFRRSFDAAVTDNPDFPHVLPNLQRLSLHECSTLQGRTFECLLNRLPNLTHLEVSHTLITNKALASIPETARLTHLNISRCTKLSGEVVVDFLTNHPAAKNLQLLSVMSDAARHRILEAEDLDRLLPNLPSTLRSLNINGSDVQSHHLPLLLALRSQLDELSIAQSSLTLSDINSLFMPSTNPMVADKPSSLVYLDITLIHSLNRTSIFDPSNTIFTYSSLPLSVIEISDDSIISGLRSRYSTPGTGLGWIVKESGRRAWLVRDIHDGVNSSHDRAFNASVDDEESEESAYRPWKWGAKWWGMRKVPVAKQEVGGMFGHYMYKA